MATEVEPQYLALLKNIFGKYKHFLIEELDISGTEIDKYRSYHIDSVLCLNVLEHIEQEEKVLRNIFNLLESKGRLLLLVPSHPLLYGSLDRNLGHYRRYGKKELKDKLEALGFKIISLNYFNRIGTLGWLLNSKILRRKTLPALQLRMYNLLVPFFKLEKLIPLPFGTSLFAVAERKNDGDD